jgi:hypothetical protein
VYAGARRSSGAGDGETSPRDDDAQECDVAVHRLDADQVHQPAVESSVPTRNARTVP